MDSNKYKRELVSLRNKYKADAAVREYDEWKSRIDKAIAAINTRIRATN